MLLCCRDELMRLGLGSMLNKLEAAAGHDKNLLRYIQRAQQKLNPVGPQPPGHH
jgi:hypothetical protein